MENARNETRPTSAQSERRPAPEAISELARRLWEDYGRPEGRDLDIWLEAERRRLGSIARVAAPAPGSAPEPDLRMPGNRETMRTARNRRRQ